jgi:cytochrome b6-f complex iron-sulfur subunit
MSCAAGIGLAAFLQSCTTHKYITNFTAEQNKITLKRSEFISVEKGKTTQHKFILIKPESASFPIAVYQSSNDQFSSFLMQCTHLGCELQAYEASLVCPCHGAEFNTKGEVTNGPAYLPLKSFLTTNDAENIYIQLA